MSGLLEPSVLNGAAIAGRVQPTLSVVIEWENVKNAKHSRAEAMLKSLLAQLEAARPRLGGEPEIILIHDAEEAGSGEEIAASIAAIPGSGARPVRILGATGLDYYKQKNFGVRQAAGELILFVDSDVIPAHDWLEKLLDCYEQESPDVVCGATHIECDSLYAKAFALFWFFPLASEATDRQRADSFFANNVLFRRDLLLEHPFPDSDLVRGRCTQLSRTLQLHQKSLLLEGRAKVHHPAPNGTRHFIYRALCQGHDNVLNGHSQSAGSALVRFKLHLAKAIRRIWAHRQEVSLGRLGAVFTMAIASAYFGVEMVGELVTLANPRLIGDNLRI